jgi:hypothetical protein
MELNCHSLLLLYADVLIEFNLTCENIRECKKCAKASRKDLGAKHATAAAAKGHQCPIEHSLDGRFPRESRPNDTSSVVSSSHLDPQTKSLRNLAELPSQYLMNNR